MIPKKFLAAAVSVTAVFALAACSDDNDNNDATPTPTVTASESPSVEPTERPFDLVCPPPIGTVTITSAEDQWAPGIVVGTGEALYPVSFGEVTFTNTTTGETHVEPPITQTGADQTGAVECSFTNEFDDVDETGQPFHGTVTGTVSVVTQKPVVASPTASPTTS